MFCHKHSLTVAWGDCDPAGIVFYPRFFDMFDVATAHLLQAATGRTRLELVQGFDIVGWPMVDTRAEFLQPIRFDDVIEIDSKVGRLGRSSFVIEHKLMHNDTLSAKATEVRVWAARNVHDSGQLEAQTIPTILRERLSDKSYHAAPIEFSD